MSKTKRVWAFLTATVMLLSMLPTSVFADDTALAAETTAESKLFFRYCTWNSDGLIVEEDLTTSQIGISVNSSVTGCLYYGTETDAQRILAKDLEVSGGILELELRGEKELADSSLYGYIVRVQTNAFGTGTISYQGSAVTFNVTLPYFGLYTTPTATEESFLYQTVTLGSDEPYYFCLNSYMVESGYTFHSVAEAPSWATITIAEDGSYAVLEVDEDAVIESSYTFGFNMKLSSGKTNYWGDNFKIVDNRAGLRWCSLKIDENDEYYPDTTNLRKEFIREVDTRSSVAICFVKGEEVTLLELEDLTFPAFVKGEVRDTDLPASYLRLSFVDFGSDYITYTQDGVTYQLPVTVSLPMVGYFSSPVYSEDVYIGEDLTIDGKNEDGEDVTFETFYLVAQDGWMITDVVPDASAEAFYVWELSADGSYAVVTIGEGFAEESYEVRVYLENEFGTSTSEWADFDIVDDRPGLRWCWARWDSNNNMYADTANLRTEIEQDVYTSSNMAICFVDGDEITLLEPDDITLPEFMTIERADADQPITFMRLYFNDFGSEDITYTLNGVTYKLPVKVTLPQVGYYNQPIRSEETYVGSTFSFDGKDSSGESVAYETFYVVAEEGWSITSLEPQTAGMEFFSWEVPSGKNYAVVTVAEDFTDVTYAVKVYLEDGSGDTDWSRINFKVKDLRPGLRYKYVDIQQTVYGDLKAVMDGTIGTGTWIAFYYTENGVEQPIRMSDLAFPAFVEASLLIEGNDYYTNVEFIQFGTGEITCDLYPNCKMPVSVALPNIAFYSENERSEENYLGSYLPFNGTLTDENGVAYETFYILPKDGWYFTGLDVDPNSNGYDMSFLEYSIAADGSYIQIHLKEGFEDVQYRLNTFFGKEGSSGTGNQNLWFRIDDLRAGLRWCWVEWDDNGNMYADTSNLYSTISSEINEHENMAICYVKGDEITLLEMDDLNWPDLMEAELADEEQSATLLYLSFNDFGSGNITYTLDGVTYKLPVKVTLPHVGYYTQPVRSEETYAGRILSFDGKDETGAPVDAETFYVIASDGWTITGLEPQTAGMEFYSWEIPTGKDYAVVTIDDTFTSGSYELKVYLKNANGSGWIREGFEIADNRPGLKWCYVPLGDDESYTPATDVIYGNFNVRVTDGRSVAFFFVDEAGSTTQVTAQELTFPAFVSVINNPKNTYWLDFTKPGTGKITYVKDGISYQIPVTVGLPEVAYYSSAKPSETSLLMNGLSGKAGSIKTAYLIWDPTVITAVEDICVWHDEEWISISNADLTERGMSLTWLENSVKIEAEIGKATGISLRVAHENGWHGRFLRINSIIEPAVNDEIAELIPEEGQTVVLEDVQQALAEKKEAIKQALNDELSGQTGGTATLVQKLEDASDITVIVTAEEEAPFTEAAVLGAALNAASGEEEVELVITAVDEEVELPEQYAQLGTDCIPFSMTLLGAVDADETTAGQQLVVPVQIRLPIPDGFDPHLTVLLHYLSNGEVEVIDAQVSDGYITFVTDGFSDYALVNMATVSVTNKGLEIKIANTNASKIMAAAYSESGQMLGVCYLNNGEGTIICKSANASEVRFFLLDDDYAPISNMKTVSVNR